jgi:hypothetical protein
MWSFKIKIILFLVLFIAILSSCKKKEEPKIDYRLTPEDLTWNIYHEGDSLKFLSNLNHFRGYYIEYAIQHITYAIPILNEAFNSYESVGIGFGRYDSIFENNRFAMGMYRGYPGEGDIFEIMAFWHDDLQLPEQFIIQIEPQIDTLTINGNLYSNILVFENFINHDIPSAAKKIYYHKQKGWLRFELNSGEFFDRIN